MPEDERLAEAAKIGDAIRAGLRRSSGTSS
jgi:hypothetical protein